jgi:hypothetical protein
MTSYFLIFHFLITSNVVKGVEGFSFLMAGYLSSFFTIIL